MDKFDAAAEACYFAAAELCAAYAKELDLPNVGFINATLRTVTAGRLATPNPDAPVSVPPDPPTNLAASATTGSTFWKAEWDAAVSNDSYGILGYKVYENGVLVGVTSALTFSLDERTPSTGYAITVKSYTVHKTSTTAAGPITITTDASGGIDPPVDTGLPTDPTAVTAVNAGGGTVTMTWGASTDADGVFAYVLYRDGNPLDFVASPTLTWTSPVQTSGLTHRFGVQAVDNSGNRSAIVYANPLTIPGTIVVPPAPRTFSGAITDAALEVEGVVVNVGPAPAARSIEGDMTDAALTVSGTISNQATVDDPPVWNTPSVDTTYSYNEGDTVDLTLAATDPEGNPITYSFASGDLPNGVGFVDATHKLYGVIGAGAGGYPAPLDYDSYYNASDVVAVTPISISTTSIPTATVGVAYTTTLAAANGYGPPYYWTLVTDLPAPLLTEITLNPTTGVLSGTPSVQFTGPIVVTATDPQSNVAQKQFTFAVAAVSTGDNFVQVATDEGVYYATNINKVYVDLNDDGFAEEQPSRLITSKARLLQETSANTGNGYLNADQLDWDTTTFGFPVLKMACRSVDGAQGGDWQQWVNGRTNTLIRRFYLFWSVYFPPLSLGYRYLLNPNTTQNLKVMKIDDAGNGQLFYGLVRWSAAVMPTINQSTGFGPSISSGNNPWGRSGTQCYNALGFSSAWSSEATLAEKKARYLADNGSTPRSSEGDFDTSHAVPNPAADYAANRLDLRAHPNGLSFPDPRPGGLVITPDTWIPFQSFQEYNLVDNAQGTFQMWAATDWMEPPVLLCDYQNQVPFGAAGANSWAYIQRLNYDTERPSEVGRPDLIQYDRRIVTSRKPIRFPNGLYPPGNLG